MLTTVCFFSCMVISISTNTNRVPTCSWPFGKKSQRNPQKVNSLIYKDYSLIEYEDGTKSYVSPEEKTQLLLERKLKFSKTNLENEKIKVGAKDSDSDSDSGYEVPVARDKIKSCDDLHKNFKPEIKKNGSFPFLGGEMSPEDNGRINLPPYIVPLETSLTFPMTKQKRKDKKKKKRIGEIDADAAEKSQESPSPDETNTKNRFSLKDSFWTKNKKKSSETEEAPEDPKVREITEIEGLKSFDESDDETKENPKLSKPPRVTDHESEADEKEKNSEKLPKSVLLVEPVEVLFENRSTRKFSHNLHLPKFPSKLPKAKERRPKNQKLDPNPLKNMFKIRGVRKLEGGEDADRSTEGPWREKDGIRGRYDDAILCQIHSDTESADHGSTDKSSVSKLTSEKESKKLMSGLFGSFRKGRSKDKVSDNDAVKNPSSFEVTVKEHLEDVGQTEIMRTEGIVYAELDMARSPGSIMRRDDEKTEYAEIIYPGTKLAVERRSEEFRKSRENLTTSRENLTEVDEAFSTKLDGKKEAAV